jgi:hypothetical protein
VSLITAFCDVRHSEEDWVDFTTETQGIPGLEGSLSPFAVSLSRIVLVLGPYAAAVTIGATYR